MNIRSFLAASTACLMAGGLTVFAAPRGGSNLDREFVLGSSDKDNWSCGVTFSTRERQVEILEVETPLDSTMLAAYIGYAITPWATLYGIAGEFSSEFDSVFASSKDNSFLYGASLQLDLFSHEIQDPMLMENKIRVNATLGYVASQVEAFGDEQDFQEFQASLTASIVNDVVGSKLFLPESIAVFAGPVYSSTLSDDVDDSPDDNVGMTVGLEIFHTKRVSYYASMEDFDNVGYSAGLNVRF